MPTKTTNNQFKVGDIVGVKCDIEQTGRIEKIDEGTYQTKFFVRCFAGEYVQDKVNGSLMQIDLDHIWKL